jgi:uncharacterized protein (DUF736 family)
VSAVLPVLWSTAVKAAVVAELEQRRKRTMANLGIFTRTSDGFTGTVRTIDRSFPLELTVAAQKSKETSPDYRGFSGQAEVAAAWEQTSQKSGQDYVSVRISDPSLPRPIRANLVQTKAASDTYLLLQRTR